MDNSPLIILLICVLVIIPIGAAFIFRRKRGSLRRDSGVPTGFGMDASSSTPDQPHHHHHSTAEGGHHHSHGAADAGGSHHGGGDAGGGGGHH